MKSSLDAFAMNVSEFRDSLAEIERQLLSFAIRLTRADSHNAICEMAHGIPESLLPRDFLLLAEISPETDYAVLLTSDPAVDAEQFRSVTHLNFQQLFHKLNHSDYPCDLSGTEEFNALSRLVCGEALPAGMLAPLISKHQIEGFLIAGSSEKGIYHEERLRLLHSAAVLLGNNLSALKNPRNRQSQGLNLFLPENSWYYQRDFSSDRFIFLGKQIERFFGLSSEELTPKRFISMIQECQFEKIKNRGFDEMLSDFMEGRIPTWDAQCRMRLPNGEEKWVSDISIHLTDERGRLCGSLGIIEDITERKENEIREQAFSRLSYAAQSATTAEQLCRICQPIVEEIIPWDFLCIACLEADGAFRILKAYDMVDGEKREFPEERQRDISHSPMLERLQREGAFLATRKELDRENLPIHHLGNQSKQTECFLFAPISGRDGELIGAITVQSYTPNHYQGADLQIIKRVAETISASLENLIKIEQWRVRHERLKDAVASAKAAVYRKEIKHLTVFSIDPVIKEILGYEPCELEEGACWEVVLETRMHGKLTGVELRKAYEMVRDGEIERDSCDLKMRSKEGKPVWLSNKFSAVRNHAGQVLEIQGILQDITQRIRDEEILRSLNILGLNLGKAATKREAAAMVLETARNTLGWDAAVLALYDSKTDLCDTLLAYDSINGSVEDFSHEYDYPLGPGPFFRRALEEREVLIENYTMEEITNDFFGYTNQVSRSMMYITLTTESEPVGILSIQSYIPNYYDARSLELLKVLADICGSAFVRITAQDQRIASEARYRKAISQANAVAYQWDFRTKEFTFAGRQLEALTGLPPEPGSLRKLWEQITEVRIPGDTHDTDFSDLLQRFEAGQVSQWRVDYRVRLPAGGHRWLADSATLLRDESGEPVGSLGFLQDITPRMELAERDQALTDLGRRLSAARTSKEAAKIACRSAQRMIGWDAAMVLHYNQSQEAGLPVIGYDTTEKHQQELLWMDRNTGLEAHVFQQLHHKGALHINHGSEAEASHALAGQWGLGKQRRRSLLYAPIRQDERIIGLVTIQSYREGRYSSHDLRLLQTIADHMSNAFQRTVAEEKLRLSERRSSAFSVLAHRLNSVRSPREAGMIIADAAEELLGWDAFDINFYYAGEQRMHHILTLDTRDGKKMEFNPKQYIYPLPESARIILDRGAFLYDPSRPGNPISFRPSVNFGSSDMKTECALFSPVRKGKMIIGFITIQSYRPGAYHDEDIETLQTLADQCGGALERLKVEKSLADERQRIGVFADLGKKLSAAASPREASRTLLEAARKLAGWECAFAILTPNHTPTLYLEHSGGVFQELDPNTISDGMLEYADRALHEGKFMIHRAPDDTGGEGMDRRMRSMLFVPIRDHKRRLGVLSLQSAQYHAYREEDLSLMESLADHCAGALKRLQAQSSVRESEERYSLAAQGSNDGLWDWDIRKGTVFFSDRFHDMLHRMPKTLPPLPDSYTSLIHPEDRSKFRRELRLHLVGRTVHFQNEHRLKREDGQYIWVLCRGVAVRDATGRPIRLAGSATDISARRDAEEQLRKAAFFDILTGLPNRSLFIDRLESALKRSRRSTSQEFAVLFLDIDRFKMVNDSLGHLTGDELLKQIAQRLQKTVREGDTVARLGGDEFTILLEPIYEQEETLRIANRIIDQLGKPFQIEGRELFTGVSVGIATALPSYRNGEEILRDADTALYRAKEKGRGCFVVFDHEMHETVIQTMEMETQLRKALRQRELSLSFIPILSVTDKQCEGFEAAVTWPASANDPEAFQALAEEIGLIVEIGDWMIETAASLMAELEITQDTAERQYLAVPISERQLNLPNFTESIESMMDNAGYPLNRLRFVLRESALIADQEQLAALASRWEAMGLRIILDDYGSGYSSISQLVQLPVESIKVQRQFIQDIANNSENRNIAEAVIGLAGKLGVRVIGEGIDSESALTLISELGCHAFTGESRGLTIEQIEELLQTGGL